MVDQSGNYRVCLEILVPCEIGNRGFAEKLFFRLRKLKSHLGIADNGDLSPDEILRLSKRLMRNLKTLFRLIDGLVVAICR